MNNQKDNQTFLQRNILQLLLWVCAAFAFFHSCPIIALEPSSSIHQEAISTQKKSIDEYRFTFPERLLRLCYFRLAVSEEDYLERLVDFFCDTLNIASWHTESLIPTVAKKTLEAFKIMGAQEHYVITLDGKGIIHSLTFQAKHLEEKINTHGGAWKRVKTDHQTVFAIFPPQNPTLEWKTLETDCFSMFGWKKKSLTLPNLEVKDAFITCENADLIDENKTYQCCFLYCHANSHSFIRERERAGFYLGMKQDFCFFDQRGVGYSIGIPSEIAFYLDIEAVYNQLMKTHPYPFENLWIGGFCAGGPVAAYLKAQFHERGINFFAEQSFSDLMRDFIETRNFIIRWVGKKSLGGLKSPDIPIDLLGRPKEYNFSIEQMWKKLPYQIHGKIIIVHTLNDQFLPSKVRQRFVEIAQSINRNVIPIFYFSTQQRDVHSDSFYLYPDVNRRFIEAVFQ